MWQSLSETFHFDLIRDSIYRGKYIDYKGKVAEQRVLECFSKIFSDSQLHQRIHYDRMRGYPDIDLLVNEKKTVLLIECSSKWITQESKQGDISSIKDHLKKSIVKCSEQLIRDFDACKNGKIKFGKEKKIIPIIVVDNFIPYVERILKNDEKINEIGAYIIDTYDLDIITDLADKKEFINFISKRIELSKKRVIFAVDEIDYFLFLQQDKYKLLPDKFKQNNSEMLYTGHLEIEYPTYYGEKFAEFINDPELIELLGPERVYLAQGWS